MAIRNLKSWLIALTPSELAALEAPLNVDWPALGPSRDTDEFPVAEALPELLSPSIFLNQVSNFFTNFQFFFFNSTAARYY